MFLAIRPVLTRVLVPILLVLYLAPFVTAPDRVAGIVRRTRRRDDDPATATDQERHASGRPDRGALIA